MGGGGERHSFGQDSPFQYLPKTVKLDFLPFERDNFNEQEIFRRGRDKSLCDLKCITLH